MKRYLQFYLILAGVAMTSCSESSAIDKDHIVGRWQLSKKEDKNSKSIDLTNKPTVLILNIQKNGYFIYYDSVVSQNWINTGVPRIQVQSKGQWELKDNELILTDPDQNTTDKMIIESLSETDMVTKSSGNEEKVFTTYGKK